MAFAGLLCAASPLAAAPSVQEVVKTYADIAQAGYEDALAGAKTLKSAIDRLVAKPTSDSLEEARRAWKAARVPYMQTEAYRFGNKIVDEWEGRVNAWPLDEGLIDYVDKSYGTTSDSNPLFTANVIANRRLIDRRATGGCEPHHQGAAAKAAGGRRRSKPMWRPAITRSSFCCGARI